MTSMQRKRPDYRAPSAILLAGRLKTGAGKHGGPGRYRHLSIPEWHDASDYSVHHWHDGASDPDNLEFQASWRQVDVRFRNGWPHDLRPENLALLCTRCESARNNVSR